jgi:hypothetical protein
VDSLISPRSGRVGGKTILVGSSFWIDVGVLLRQMCSLPSPHHRKLRLQFFRRLVFYSSEECFRLEKEAHEYNLLELQERDELDSRVIARLYVTCGLGLSEAGEVSQNWKIWPPQATWRRNLLKSGGRFPSFA